MVIFPWEKGFLCLDVQSDACLIVEILRRTELYFVETGVAVAPVALSCTSSLAIW